VINPAATIPQATATNGSDSTASTSPPSEGLNNMFLQLLVAQLQNQSPLEPMDPTQFVGQLAQFSELSEVTQIDQTLQELAGTVSGSTKTGSGTTGQSRSTSSESNPARSGIPVPSAPPSAAASAGFPDVTPSAISWLKNRIEGVF
jgi:flagellar basal-body rod modification protein FlgD